MKIETKYNINDKVWLMYANKIKEGEVTGFMYTESNNLCNWVNIKQYCINLLPDIQMYAAKEEVLFATKEELIATL